MLDRTRQQPRKFLRLVPARLEALLDDRGPQNPTSPERAGTPPAVPAEGEPEIEPADVSGEPEDADPRN